MQGLFGGPTSNIALQAVNTLAISGPDGTIRSAQAACVALLAEEEAVARAIRHPEKLTLFTLGIAEATSSVRKVESDEGWLWT